MTLKTSIVRDTDMKVTIRGVTDQTNRFRHVAPWDHAGRTTAETRRQLELNYAAQVASGAMSKYVQLVSSVPPRKTVKHLTQAMWNESWASTTKRLQKCMPASSNREQDVGLSRRAWTRLIRLRTGVGRFGANDALGTVHKRQL